MEAKDGRKAAELDPSGSQLRVVDTSSVAADVVAPPSVSDIGCCGSELGLEVQTGPLNMRIA